MTRPDPLSPDVKIAWVLLAAGSSTRFSGVRSKLLEPLGDGRVIDVTLSSLRTAAPVAEVILVSSPELRDELQTNLKWTKGGARRQDSARMGLSTVSNGAHIALIHDAARPFVSRTLLERLLSGLRNADACCPGVPVTDTIRTMQKDRIETLDRSCLWAMQTPQAIWLDIALPAFEKTTGPEEFTDDLAVIAAHGGRIAITEGDRRNIKITTRDDLHAAERILREPNIP